MYYVSLNTGYEAERPLSALSDLLGSSNISCH